MDMNSIISAAAIVIVAIIEAIAARERKHAKRDKEKVERRAELRAEESRLSMRMVDANLDFAIATALAVEQKKINGEMKRAKEKAAAAQLEYTEFLERVTASQVAKV